MISNASTLGGFVFGSQEIAFILVILGVIVMPIITAHVLYKVAIQKNQKHFIKGFIILTTAYLFTNIPVFIGNLDGHGRALFNLIILIGLIICLVTSIITEYILLENAKLNANDKK